MSQKPIKETLAVSDNSLDLLRLFAALQIAIAHYLNLSLLRYGIRYKGDQFLLGLKRVLSLYPGLIILLTISGFLMGGILKPCHREKGFCSETFPENLSWPVGLHAADCSTSLHLDGT